MMSDDSRQAGIKEAMKSTGASLFFRSIGRETRPAWGNRIVKDFYDLDYDVQADLFKHTAKFRNSELTKQKKLRADLEKSKLARRKPSLDTTKLPNRSLSLSRKSKHARPLSKHNPETIDLGELPSSQQKYLGLCPFEFQNTIVGRMQGRANHHLSFQKNRVQRPPNLNPVHYNHNEDIDFSHRKAIIERHHLKKYHPFDSYTDRRVFEPRDELDKIFNTDQARLAASPNRLRNSPRKFDSVLPRKESRVSESAVLSYETVPCIEKLKKKSVSYSINSSPRETDFMPQVISDKRGCYR